VRSVKPFRLSRRAVLRGAGTVAIALPWLEIMGEPRVSRAQGAPARRFVTMYQPGGSVLESWVPLSTEPDFLGSTILSALSAVRDHVLVLHGVDMKSALGEQNQAGMVALLTGTVQGTAGTFAKGPSLDQVLAKIAESPPPIPTLELAVRWGTGKAKGAVSPIDILNFADSPGFAPIAPRLDPVAIWNDLFGEMPQDAGTAWDRSMLDAVVGRYTSLSARLGAADRARLDEHLTHLRALEQELAAVSCVPPELIDTSDYDPAAGLNSADDGSIRDVPTDSAIPKVGRLMTEMLVLALACDRTNVATLQFVDSAAQYTLPWLDLNDTHACYMNDCGYRVAECTTICSWYAGEFAHLVQRMSEIDMGGHSLLDESVVFYGSHLQNVATHMKQSMPFVLAGHGGGLVPGRALTFDHASHNDLLSAIANLFGDARTTFGDAMYASAPLVL